jgi:ketopantoate reductase
VLPLKGPRFLATAEFDMPAGVRPLSAPPASGKKILSAFRQAGFTCKAVDNLQQLIWGKLIINVGINALAAVTGLKNGRLPEIRSTRAIMEMAVEEAVAVARAKEIVLPYPDPIGRVRRSARPRPIMSPPCSRMS